ncbi:hypothetical protein H920_16224 [Fukomys damarensis]|uniref:Uncharacterized protein n=1 Tax=Fukomys damarensis TaxID=885580 RepID=A0A091CWY2_FUKDA|nr:hypothetical protein H920_16224 [Fukomys damarensis]
MPRAVPAPVRVHSRYLRSERRRLPPLKTCRLGCPAPRCLLPAALSAQTRRLRVAKEPRMAEAHTRKAHPGSSGGEDSKVTARPRQELPARLTVARERFRSLAPPPRRQRALLLPRSPLSRG